MECSAQGFGRRKAATPSSGFKSDGFTLKNCSGRFNPHPFHIAGGGLAYLAAKQAGEVAW